MKNFIFEIQIYLATLLRPLALLFVQVLCSFYDFCDARPVILHFYDISSIDQSLNITHNGIFCLQLDQLNSNCNRNHNELIIWLQDLMILLNLELFLVEISDLSYCMKKQSIDTIFYLNHNLSCAIVYNSSNSLNHFFSFN